MTERRQCSHPVQRRGRLSTCRRDAAWIAYDLPGGYGRALCTFHKVRGRFNARPWDRVEAIEAPAPPEEGSVFWTDRERGITWRRVGPVVTEVTA